MFIEDLLGTENSNITSVHQIAFNCGKIGIIIKMFIVLFTDVI